jgi:hypothetical protein
MHIHFVILLLGLLAHPAPQRRVDNITVVLARVLVELGLGQGLWIATTFVVVVLASSCLSASQLAQFPSRASSLKGTNPIPSPVIEISTLAWWDALVPAGVGAQIVSLVLDLGARELVLVQGADACRVVILLAGGAGLGLVGVEIFLGLLDDLLEIV